MTSSERRAGGREGCASRRRRLPRIAGEFALIVVGVFIAQGAERDTAATGFLTAAADPGHPPDSAPDVLWTLPFHGSSEPAAPAGTPLVFLDHLYIVVDSATYDAIAASPLLRDRLAMFGERTNRSGAESWTALGVGGERTYIEVFRVGARYPTVGTAGIAFSVGTPGGLDSVACAFAGGPDITVRRSRRTGVMGGREMAWYRSLRIGHGGSPAAVSRWVMEYERPFREALLGDSVDAVTGPELRRWLRAGRFDPSRSLRDVTGLVLALPAGDAAAFRTELEAFGYALRETGEGYGYEARGPDVSIRVVRAADQPGIRELRLRLEGAGPESTEHALGPGSRLRVVDDTTAVWEFGVAAAQAHAPVRTPVWTFNHLAEDGHAFAVAAGDIDPSDAAHEMVVSQPFFADRTGRVLYFADLADTVPDAVLSPPAGVPASLFGVSVAVGDINGDGAADVAVGERTAGLDRAWSAPGRAFIFFGDPAGGPPDATPDLVLENPDPGPDGAADNFGDHVHIAAPPGVELGRGLARILVGARTQDEGRGEDQSRGGGGGRASAAPRGSTWGSGSRPRTWTVTARWIS